MIAHTTARSAWEICNTAGRSEISGMLRVEAVTATLEAIGGTQEDLGRIIGIIEPIWKKLNPVKQSGK